MLKDNKVSGPFHIVVDLHSTSKRDVDPDLLNFIQSLMLKFIFQGQRDKYSSLEVDTDYDIVRFLKRKKFTGFDQINRYGI